MSTEAERPRVRMAAIVSGLSAGWLERAAIWVVLLALLGVAALFSDAFVQPIYLFNMVRQAAPVGMAAIGVTLVMVMGGVDLSVGAVISLAAVVAAVLMDGQAGNIGYALAATLTIGAAIGFANGVLIAWNRASPFILTLGTAVAVYGLTQIYSGGTARGIVAPGFREFFNQRIGGLVPVLALLIATASVSAQTARPAEPLPAEVQALRAQSAKLYEQGKYDEAIPLAQQYRERVELMRSRPTRSRASSPPSAASRCSRARASPVPSPGAASSSTPSPRSCSEAPPSRAAGAASVEPWPDSWSCSSPSIWSIFSALTTIRSESSRASSSSSPPRRTRSSRPDARRRARPSHNTPEGAP